MGFYDEIAKDISWEYATDAESWYRVKNGKLQLPSVKWLQYHLHELDKVIEVIHAFRQGSLRYNTYDTSVIQKYIIDDPIQGIAFLKQLDSNYSLYAIDIETDNLLTDKEKNKLLCIGLAFKEDAGVSFSKNCFDDVSFKDCFQQFINEEKNRFILHNGIFDKSRTKIIEGIDLKISEDTLLMHYCGINEHKGTHGLKDLAQLYLGFPEWEKELDDWKRQYCRMHKMKLKDFQYSYFPRKVLQEYNVIDCCATFQLFIVFQKLMRDSSLYIYKKLIEASAVYAGMISRGMLLDINYWNKLRDDLETEKATLEKELEIYMPNVKITSPVQLLRWLQTKYPFEGIDTTGKEVIADLSLKYPEDEALQKLLAYRKNVKYLKTYAYGLYERKDSNNIIHCEFKLHGTETGRLSSANPNMQNIPRNKLIKSLFVSRPGYKLLQFDYSQCELRTLAYITQDETLMECYREGRDLHSEMAQRIFKDKYDPQDKEQRTAAKLINFGIPYGRMAGSIAKQLKVSISVAKQYLDDWFKGAPKVKDYMEKCRKMATSEPQDVWYTVFGRARHYFVTSENIHSVENQAINFPISSTANDLTIHSIVEINKYIKEHNLDAYIVNTVHDSIILETNPKHIKELTDECLFVMSEMPKKFFKDLTMPFKADAEVGECYGALQGVDEYFDEEDSVGDEV